MFKNYLFWRKDRAEIVPGKYIDSREIIQRFTVIYCDHYDNGPVCKIKTITKAFQGIRSFKTHSIMTLNLRRILYKLDFIKIKNFGASQDTINNEKEPKEWEKHICKLYIR